MSIKAIHYTQFGAKIKKREIKRHPSSNLFYSLTILQAFVETIESSAKNV